MRRNIPTIFVIFLLGMLVLVSACTGPATEEPQQNTSVGPRESAGPGLVQVTVQPEYSRISFDTALKRLRNYTTLSSTQAPAGSEKLYYILAKDVDGQGNATSWIFGLSDGSGSRLLIFDRTGKTEMHLGKSSLPSGEIVLDRVVPPEKVFSVNKEAIRISQVGSAPEQRELELMEGVYTLTITSAGTARTIRMNAATGALMV